MMAVDRHWRIIDVPKQEEIIRAQNDRLVLSPQRLNRLWQVRKLPGPPPTHRE